MIKKEKKKKQKGDRKTNRARRSQTPPLVKSGMRSLYLALYLLFCVCMSYYLFYFFFFFFQAEDGILDIGVTGVQTCALPILCPRHPSRSVRSDLRRIGCHRARNRRRTRQGGLVAGRRQPPPAQGSGSRRRDIQGTSTLVGQ